MGKFFVTVLLSMLPAMVSGQLKGGYEIAITLDGLPDSTVFLAYHLGDKQYIKDTLKLDRSGHGIVKGNGSSATGSLYDSISGQKIF